MLDAAIHERLTIPLDRIARVLARLGLTANALTVAGFVFGVIGVAFIGTGAYLIGLAFLVVDQICDGLDGPLARRTRETLLGSFFDASFPYILYAGVAFAFTLARPTNVMPANFMLLGLATEIATALAFRICEVRLAGLPGARPILRPPTLCERSESFVFLVVICVFPLMFAVLPYIYGIACFASAGMRAASAITYFRAPIPR